MAQVMLADRVAFRTSEAAEMTAVHPATLRRAVRTGELKAVHLGGRLRFTRENLELWLDRLSAQHGASGELVPHQDGAAGFQQQGR